MKKLGILALAALMVAAFAMPASALENTFGGYWETTFATLNDYDGSDVVIDDDSARVDTRLRLYYTAGLNDNLKIVTKFEIDYTWGDQASTVTGAGGKKATTGGIGDVGADGTGKIEVKNIYADFNLGPVNVKMGTQGFTIARGIVYDTDGSGITLTYSPMDMVTIPVVWLKSWETSGNTANNEDDDFDIYGVLPIFKFGEGISVQPMIVKAATDNLGVSNGIMGTAALAGTELDAWFYGIDVSAAFGPLSLYGVYVAESGEISPVGAASIDLSGFALDLGVSYDFGMFSLRGEYAMLSGDDDAAADNDLEAFTATSGESWAKGELLMNNSILWKVPYNGASPLSAGTPAQNNFLATSSGMKLWNLGATVKPIDKLSLALDYYNADFAETAAGADEEIGSEIDFIATYQLLEGLKLDVLACFYQVGDAVNPAGVNDEDQTMYGARFSVSW